MKVKEIQITCGIAPNAGASFCVFFQNIKDRVESGKNHEEYANSLLLKK
jgi:hypothetical protein